MALALASRFSRMLSFQIKDMEFTGPSSSPGPSSGGPHSGPPELGPGDEDVARRDNWGRGEVFIYLN